MMDIADHAQNTIDAELDRALQARPNAPTTGPYRCLQCGCVNDRRAVGYATCTDCEDERIAGAVADGLE